MYKFTAIELLDGFIEDFKDAIDDYEDDIKRGCGRLEQYEKRIRIDELRQWLKTFKIIREEQSQIDNRS